eukprot:jgi/Pico_ML_1/52777/g3436.t1
MQMTWLEEASFDSSFGFADVIPDAFIVGDTADKMLTTRFTNHMLGKFSNGLNHSWPGSS